MLNGYEIIRLGAKPGPQVGLVAKELYIEQLSERITDKQRAVSWVKDWLKKHKS